MVVYVLEFGDGDDGNPRYPVGVYTSVAKAMEEVKRAGLKNDWNYLIREFDIDAEWTN